MAQQQPSAPAGPHLGDRGDQRTSTVVVEPRRDRVDEGKAIVWAVAFLPDGRWIATGSAGQVQLWELTGRQLSWELTIARRRGDVFAVAVSPDGKYLAAGSGKRLLVWDLATRQLLWEQAVGRRLADVYSVAFSPDGRRLAAASDDMTAATTRVWDAASGEQVLAIEHDDAAAMAVAFSPDGTRLAIGGNDGTGGIWDAATGLQLFPVRHEEGINAVAFCPDGQRFATASADATARVWDATSGAQLLQVHHDDRVNAVAFSPEGTRVATGGEDSSAWVWDATTGDRLVELEHDTFVNAMMFSPDGQHLVLGCSDGLLALACPPEERPRLRPAGSTQPADDGLVSTVPAQLGGTEDDESVDLLADPGVALLMTVGLAVVAGLIPWLLLGAWLSWEGADALYPESSWVWWILDGEAVPIWVLLAWAAGAVLLYGAADLFPADPRRQWRQTVIALVAMLGVLAVAVISSAWALSVLDRF